MGPLKFCANLTTMFTDADGDMGNRYQLAKNLGFHAVEAWDVYGMPLSRLVAAKERAGVDHILLNTPLGDTCRGDFGLASLPSRHDDFLASLDVAFEYAAALNCPKLHVVAGQPPADASPEQVRLTYRRRLEIAVKKAQQANVQIVIEPVSRVMRPHYFLTSVDQAMTIIREFNTPHLRLLLDLFHLQLISGNITNTIQQVFPWIGHVQFAQAPNRHEPDTPGEVNFRYVFDLLHHLGYDQWIGCEYIPQGRLEDGLRWIKDFGYALD